MPDSQRRVIVISKHPLFREGLGRLLGGADGFELIGVVDTAADAEPLAVGQTPDLIIVDGKQGDDYSAEELTHLLNLSASQVVTLSLADPDMVVYTRHQVTRDSAEDLLGSLRGGK